jgi:hypothetical protein
MTLTTRQSHHPPGDPVTHLDSYSIGRRPPGRLHQCTSFGLDGPVSPVPPLGTGRRGGGGGGEDGGPLDGAARRVAVVGGLGGCLDPVTTGPYGGSRAKKRRRHGGGETEDWLDHQRKHGENH